MGSFSLSLVFVASFLSLTFASSHRRSVGIPIQKDDILKQDGKANLSALRSHLAYTGIKYSRILAEREQGVEACSQSEPLTADGINLWYGTISVGSPPVEYKVDFDTGSSDLILPASNCGSTCDGHTLYNPNASSTAVDLQRFYTIEYGDNSTDQGVQYTDTVTIGGFEAKNQTLGAALHYSTAFQKKNGNFTPDGILGMAFKNISVMHANPVVQTLIEEGKLDDPVFAFKLASNGSELRIGGVNTSQYTGSFTYAPVVQPESPKFWRINVDSINANGQATNKNVSAIVDTGTTLIVSDDENVAQFYNQFDAVGVGYGLYAVLCNEMPNVSITIQGKSFAISADMFSIGEFSIPGFGNYCVGAVASNDNIKGIWILGDVFLRNVYTVFDVGGLQVGFADLAPSSGFLASRVNEALFDGA